MCVLASLYCGKLKPNLIKMASLRAETEYTGGEPHLIVCLFFDFLDLVFLYSPGCPGTHSVDQAGLELRNLPASASQSAGITGVCYHCPAGEPNLKARR